MIADIALLMGLIYSFHYKYAQPAVFYLKVPTLLYVFLFIALRALRFEARFVIITGLAAIAGWIALILYALSGRGGPPNMTDDFVEYMTSNALLIHAEADKLIAILLTTVVLAIAISRARHLLIRSVSEGAAARDLSRFFDPGVAARIRSAAMAVKAGEGELRDVAILSVDLRGFTRLSTELQPGDVMKFVAGLPGPHLPANREQWRQHRQIPGRRHSRIVRRGRCNRRPQPPMPYGPPMQFSRPPITGQRERKAAGLPPLAIGLALSSGRVVFGAVGDGERLEFTVIGDAVNFAAKLEKHNKDERRARSPMPTPMPWPNARATSAPSVRERRRRTAGGGRGRIRSILWCWPHKTGRAAGPVALPFPHSRPM